MVLRQSYADFELIVVGDGCKDETAEVVGRYTSRGVRWHNLDSNCGSRSAPNNFGIAQATGDWIAYVGHDDIWAPDHLERLRNLITSADDLDFAVSGCIYYGPKDTDLYYVTGMFDCESAPLNHFFPRPLSLTGRRSSTELEGGVIHAPSSRRSIAISCCARRMQGYVSRPRCKSPRTNSPPDTDTFVPSGPVPMSNGPHSATRRSHVTHLLPKSRRAGSRVTS